MQNLNEVF